MPKVMPKHNETQTPLPEHTEEVMPMPTHEERSTPLPEVGKTENTIQFGKSKIEIKPTKLKYQRDRTASFYQLLQKASVVDLLALKDGILDPNRSSDKMLFDWLIAVTDDPKLVAENYDEIDSETIHQMLQIFCRLNRIEEDDEKKEEAQTAKR